MRPINPDSLSEPRGYNNGMLYDCGRILLIAGQVGWDRSGNLLHGFTAQFEQAIVNILHIVTAAGGTPQSIGRFTIYIKDKSAYIAERKQIGEAYRKHMGKHFPAMSLLIVKDLLEDGALVEIEATAIIP